VLLSAFGAFAQTTAAVATADTTDSSKISVLSTGVSYGNTANYYGQTTARKLPYISTDLSYQSKFGFYLAGSAIKLVDVGPAFSEVDIAVGYSKDITKNLGASASYTRFFFAKDSPLPQSVNPNTVSLGLTYDFKWFNSGLNGDYVFGSIKDDQGKNMKDFYLSLTNSKEITLGSIIRNKDYITISPSISLIGGTQVLKDSILIEKPKGNNNKLNGKGSGNTLALIPPIEVPDPIPPKKGKVVGNKYIYSTTFNYITSAIKLPLAYNRAHYTVEAAYQLSVPNKNFEGIVHENQSFFTLSFTYLFYKDK